MTSDQETERVYSYNPRAHSGQMNSIQTHTILCTNSSHSCSLLSILS